MRDRNEPHYIYVHRHRTYVGCVKVPFNIILLCTVLTENWQWHIATDASGTTHYTCFILFLIIIISFRYTNHVS